MPNTSATGGPLLPSALTPASDLDFDRFLARFVRGVTGLDAGMVRPRWQEDPPDEPGKDENWCAVGVQTTEPEGDDAVVRHDPSGEGSDHLTSYAIVTVLASFYGPSSRGYASRFRDGLSIPQNREPLFLADIGLVDVGPIRAAPDLVNTTWRRRQDVTVRLRCRTDRTYAVLNLKSAQGTVHAETIETDLNVEPR